MTYEARFLAAIAAAVILVVGGSPGIAHALGLGNLNVESNLGEPLRLVIDINAVSAEEAESLDVSLATRSDFTRAGVEYPFLAAQMRFELVPGAGDNYQVIITTEEAVDDTYLHFLVSAIWSGGKAVREYTALLDPPLYSEQAPSSVNLAGSGSGGTASDVPATRSADSGSDVAETATAMSAGAGGGEVVVQRGDTLSYIVRRMNVPADIDELQAFLAIFRNNPQAFIDDNMNLLRAGAVLNMPTYDEMGAVSRSESVASYSEQLARFTAYQDRVRQQQEADSNETLDRLISQSETESQVDQPVAEPEPMVETAVDQAVTENVEAEAEIQPEATVAETETAMEEARLTIGQEDLASLGEGDSNQEQLDALKAQLAQLDESLLASGVESESVRQNLQQIQDQVERISTLIGIEDASLATAQSRAMQQDEETGAEMQPSEESVVGMADDGDGVVADDSTEQTLAESAVEPMTDTGGGESVAGDPMAADTTMELESAEPAGEVDVAESEAVDSEGGVEDEVSNESEEVLLAQQDAPMPAVGETTGDDGSSGASQADDAAADDETSSGEAADSEDAAATVAAEDDVQPEAGQTSRTTRKVSDSNILDSVKGVFSSLPDYGLKIAAGLLALLGGLFIWQRRKSRKEFDESMMDIESEEVSLNSETSIQRMSDASGIDLASASDSALELTIGGGMSYLSEEGIAGVNEEDNEVIKAGAVDPLAEADVYLAYDRDEQAVQVLKEAYADTPERGELAEKLLEIYHKQDDRRAFDALAAELHRRIDTTRNLDWEKVVSMGREVSPENGLFAGDAPAAGPSDGTLDLDDDLLDDTPSGQINLDEGGLNLATLDNDEDSVSNLEVSDLELEIAKQEEAKKADEDATLGSEEIDAPTLSQIINEEVDEKSDAGILAGLEDEISLTDGEVSLDLGGEDHEFDLIEAESKRGVSAGEETSDDNKPDSDDNKPDDVVLSLDEDSSVSEMSEASLGKLEPYHESETALELAKAYMELGEQEIAKGFIEEVLNEGSDKQKEKARTMIKDLAT